MVDILLDIFDIFADENEKYAWVMISLFGFIYISDLILSGFELFLYVLPSFQEYSIKNDNEYVCYNSSFVYIY